MCFNDYCTKLICSNRSIENIQAGIGTQAGNVIRDVTTFIVGIVWAFTINWKLSLVVLTLLPFVSILTGIHALVYIIFELSIFYCYIIIATEILSLIRTVLAFGGEEKEGKRCLNITI